MMPQIESSPESSPHLEISGPAVEPNVGQGKVEVGDLVLNSEKAGTWYYVVDCAACKATIPFKHAPEGEPILRFPTMRVRCFQCRAVHAYAADLVSHRKSVAPRAISERDRLDDAHNKARETSSHRQEDRSDGYTVGRGVVECKIEPAPPSLLQRANGVIAAVSGKGGTIFFLASSFFAIGLNFQLALNIFYPIPNVVINQSHSYSPAGLLGGVYFGATLCGLALFTFGIGCFVADSYGLQRNVFRKEVVAFVTGDAFKQSLMRRINSSAKAVSVTSLALQAKRAFSLMVFRVATFWSLIRRSARLQLRHYR
jgi:hypothetical protein